MAETQRPLSIVTRDGTVLAEEREPSAEHDRVIVVDAVPIRRRRIDIHSRLVRALAPLERVAHDADVSFALTCAPETPPHVVVDGEKVAWAVSTLVGNALRYVRRGNRIHPGGTVSVTIEIDTAASLLRIEVADDGPGMPESAAGVLRGAPDAEANAPALTLVNEVVKAQGGRIDVQASREAFDHGTTITVRLPIVH